MKFGRVMMSAAITLTLAGSALFAAPAAAFAGEAEDLEAAQQEIESQADERQEAQEQVDSLSEDSSAEDVAAAYNSVSALSSYSSLSSMLSSIDTSNPQLAFAQLQIQLAEKARQDALDRINQLEEQQELQKTCSGMLNKARVAESETRDYTGKDPADNANDKKAYDSIMAATNEVTAFMSEHDIPVPTPTAGKGKMYTATEWENIAALLENFLESLSDTGTDMVYIQDYIDQYNQYLQGASSAIANGGSASSAAGTMLGEGGTGMLFTGALAGLVVGVAGTLVFVRLKNRKTSADHAA